MTCSFFTCSNAQYYTIYMVWSNCLLLQHKNHYLHFLDTVLWLFLSTFFQKLSKELNFPSDCFQVQNVKETFTVCLHYFDPFTMHTCMQTMQEFHKVLHGIRQIGHLKPLPIGRLLSNLAYEWQRGCRWLIVGVKTYHLHEWRRKKKTKKSKQKIEQT